jgi:hypothetical protein
MYADILHRIVTMSACGAVSISEHHDLLQIITSVCTIVHTSLAVNLLSTYHQIALLPRHDIGVMVVPQHADTLIASPARTCLARWPRKHD